MLMVVVIINVSISLLCLYIAWQLKKWSRKFGAVADSVAAAERSTYKVLHNAPQSIYKGQVGVNGLRGRYQQLGELHQQLEFQLRQIRQVFLLLNLVQKFLYPGFFRSTMLTSGKRTSPKKRTPSARLSRPPYYQRQR